MAKNFTDFQQITGAYVAPESLDGATPGVKTTQASTDMHVVGYETDAPHGERRYTIESLLLTAQPYHVGLENVTNESKEYMFDNSSLTGNTSAENLTISGNLVVEGDNVVMNTTIASTSALEIRSFSPSSGIMALEVQQYGPGPIARFKNGDDLAVDMSAEGHVGIGRAASSDTTLSVLGDVNVDGDYYTSGAVNGRFVQQDGSKLDDIQPRADVTALNLSNVESHLTWLAANTTEFADAIPAKGFDLLEDGEQFSKTPTLSSVEGAGIGDYSTQKLASVEYQSDKTGDHSADIIMNEIPDGPWTGDPLTTFVKFASAGKERLLELRGVTTPLFIGDDGLDITADHIRDAYHASYPDFWSTADEVEYRDVMIPQITESYSSVSSTSATWDSTHNSVEGASATWDSTHNSVEGASATWDSVYDSVLATSATWDSVYGSVLPVSAQWNSVFSTVLATSSDWEYAHDTVTSREDIWDSTHTTVDTNSAEWSASVNNKPNDDGSLQSLPAGEAELTKVSITEGLTAQFDVKLGGAVHVLSAGQWKQGQTADIPLGEDILRFVDGILVDWIQ